MAVNPKELWHEGAQEEPGAKLAQIVEMQRVERPPQPAYRSKYAPEPIWTVSNGNWTKCSG